MRPLYFSSVLPMRACSFFSQSLNTGLSSAWTDKTPRHIPAASRILKTLLTVSSFGSNILFHQIVQRTKVVLQVRVHALSWLDRLVRPRLVPKLPGRAGQVQRDPRVLGVRRRRFLVKHPGFF